MKKIAMHLKRFLFEQRTNDFNAGMLVEDIPAAGIHLLDRLVMVALAIPETTCGTPSQ